MNLRSRISYKGEEGQARHNTYTLELRMCDEKVVDPMELSLPGLSRGGGDAELEVVRVGAQEVLHQG
jgi:hypothetical protein